MRVHFVNENLGGHATLHLHLRRTLPVHTDIEASFFDVPGPTLLHRIARAPVPGLARLDLDLSPLRDQLVRSAVVERHLRHLAEPLDVLHLYTHNAGLLSTARLRRIPTVVSLDATDRQNGYHLPNRRPTRFTATSLRPTLALERRVYAAARAVVAHSAWAADSVAGYGVDRDAIHVIPFGIPIGPRRPHRDDGGLPRIVYVGATMDRKGGWRLLDIWRRHLRTISRLLLVTRQPVASEPGLEVRNDIRTGDGRLDDLLASSHVFAMPSEIDAFGFAPMEAMAAGLPVVAARISAMPEIVESGETGLLVPPGDDDAFAAALATLVADDGVRREMGRAARRRAEEHFDVVHTTAALAAVLRSVV